MADVTGATQDDGIITRPPDGDSLADDLDNRREVTGDMLLGGHPNDALETEVPEGGETGEVKPGEDEEKPVVTAPDGGTVPEKKEEPAQPRFKSQEEAEKAHAEAVRKMTEATTQAARDKEAREKLEAELAELRAKPPEKPAEEAPVKKVDTQEEIDAHLEEVATAANEQALNELDALEPEDPDYQKKRASIWAKANAKIIKAAKAASVSAEEIAQIIDQRLETRETAAKEAKAKEDAKTAAEAAWQSAMEFGGKAGLNLNDPESADHDLFMVAESKLPDHLKGKGFTSEVGEWMVNYVRTRTGKVVLTEAEKEAAARKTQVENQVLGRGGVKPTPKPQSGQESAGSLSEDFNEVRTKRMEW